MAGSWVLGAVRKKYFPNDLKFFFLVPILTKTNQARQIT